MSKDLFRPRIHHIFFLGLFRNPRIDQSEIICVNVSKIGDTNTRLKMSDIQGWNNYLESYSSAVLFSDPAGFRSSTSRTAKKLKWETGTEGASLGNTE